MTARGAVLAMVSLFFLGMLAADGLHLGVLTGLCFVAGCVLAARYTKRDGLLTAVATPPLIFMIVLVCTEIVSSHAGTFGRTLTSAVEGTVLTMASAAPWLFSGVILGVIIAMFRGLPRCVRELRADVRRGIGPGPRARPSLLSHNSRPPRRPQTARPAQPTRPGSAARSSHPAWPTTPAARSGERAASNPGVLRQGRP